MLIPSNLNLDFLEVHAELSRNFSKNLLDNPGIGLMMPAMVWQLGYPKTFARKKKTFAGTIAKLSRSPLHPSWWSLHIDFLTGTFRSTTMCVYMNIYAYIEGGRERERERERAKGRLRSNKRVWYHVMVYLVLSPEILCCSL